MARILLAEDDASMRKFLTKALIRVGHSVVSARDGLEALAALEATPEGFDLLLADIVMPGMDGITLSQRAVEMVPTLKVMFITGFAGVTVGSGMPAPRMPVVSKPFHLKDLVDQVARLLAA